MPGGDRTGPMGIHRMTGRAAGYCAGYSVPGYMNPVYGRGARLAGRQMYGYGCGRGRGMGRGRGFRLTAIPEVNSQTEADMLKEQANILQEEINIINSRIKGLEADKETEGKK